VAKVRSELARETEAVLGDEGFNTVDDIQALTPGILDAMGIKLRVKQLSKVALEATHSC
jgi:hypothetical protein